MSLAPAARIVQIQANLRGGGEYGEKAEIAKLAPLARKVLIRLKEPKTSELRQLWVEQGDKRWLSAISELQARLQ